MRPLTAPPMPPGTERERLLIVEHKVDGLERELEGIKSELEKQTGQLATISNTLLVASTEKSAADKRRESFMKWVVGVAIGVSVMALGTLSAWVIHLQTALSK